jgi:hypothetical protein
LRYEGIHYDFERSRVGFSGKREPATPFDPYQRNAFNSNWIAVLLVLIVPAVISMIFYIISKRNDRIKSDL